MTKSLVWMSPKVNVWAMLQTDLGKGNMPIYSEKHRCSNRQNMYMHNI